MPHRANHPIVRWAGKAGLWLLWFKAMSLSVLVWTFGFCFALFGALLPWTPLPWINWILLLIGMSIFYAAYRLDKVFWTKFRDARSILRGSGGVGTRSRIEVGAEEPRSPDKMRGDD